MNYLSAKEIKNKYKITTQTLYNWRKKNLIKYKVLPSGSYVYIDLDSKENPIEKLCSIYARVSTTKQKLDLDRQIQTLQNYAVSNGYKVNKIYSDIASGMNEDRKQFNDLLNDVFNHKCNTVFISYKDRLTRFGFGYLEKMFDLHNCKIIVLNSTKEEDFQTELTQDLVSIIHHFSMKMYSKRRKELKNVEKNLKKDSISV